MESLPIAGEEGPEKGEKVALPIVTEQDRSNAKMREAIAAKQEAAWNEAYLLAFGALGPGYTPWMRLSLIDSDHHNTGNTESIATVYKVYRGEERLTENSVFVMRRPDGTITKSKNHEELFGDLLKEKHPTRGFEHNGTWCAFDRWTLVWSALELYKPRSAEALAQLRATRESNKDAKFAEDYPLFDLAGFERQDKKR